MSDRGYLKPWFVKADDFRVVDSKKAKLSVMKKACWICGHKFEGPPYALVCAPSSAATRIFREPPCHEDCAVYAMQVCPFILYPNTKRRTAGLKPEETMEYVNKNLQIKSIPDNPGEYYLVLVRDFYFDSEKMTIYCNERDIIERQHWIGGKKQKEHPIPVVSYDSLPADFRGQISKEEYDLKCVNPLKARVSKRPKYVTVSHSKFKTKYWRRPYSFSFTKQDSSVALSLSEISDASLCLPLAFKSREGEAEIVAILGSHKTGNIYVDQSGNWTGSHIPTIYRFHPFKIAESKEEGGELVVDEFSELVSDSNSDSQRVARGPVIPFYDETGKLCDELFAYRSQLNEISQSTSRITDIVAQLAGYSLLKKWELDLVVNGEKRKFTINDLLCVDKNVLDCLPSNKLFDIHTSGALFIAHCQFLSMRNIAHVIRRLHA